ncbi:MAG TPA: hypothetical protein VEZ20_07285 [Allosphingosinicella sp.]|nr:hypothetical protein [Allosphingosinicella sp.]
MTRSLDQILTEQKIELSPHLIRTPDATVSVHGSWILSEFNWSAGVWPRYYDGPSSWAIALLIFSIWILANPIPRDMPWLIPACFAVSIGALWSIGLWAANRWLVKRPAFPDAASRGLTFSISGSEGSVTIFQSDDEAEIKLLRQALEKTLLPSK